jgi:hypothetical protein
MFSDTYPEPDDIADRLDMVVAYGEQGYTL